jgi:catechol-2,3-dioxygenase
MADFDQQTSKVLAPSALAHVVLQTANLERMIDFYTTFLGGTVTHRNEMLAFITYDEEHHRIALIGLPDTTPKVRGSCGLDHVSFAFPDLTSLLLAYRQRKAHGIEPDWSVNHGPTTSIYYKDPDGNKLETQVDNFDTNEAATQFMESAAFAENAIGTDFDPEELIERIKAGEEDKSLKKRVEIGARGIPAHF